MSNGPIVIGQITEAKMSKSGKTLGLKVNGQWYSTKDFHWQAQVGQNVQFESAYQPIGDGGITWANNIAFHQGGPSGPATPTRPSAPVAKKQAERTLADITYLLPITSNTVAHAIQAGLIEKPNDVKAWARAAFESAKALCEGQQDVPADDFDDDIPF